MKYIDLPHFKAIYVSFTTDEKSFKKELKRVKAPFNKEWVPEGSFACTHYWTNDNGELWIVVCTRALQKNDVRTIGSVFAHEAYHVWYRICEHIGEHYPSNELSAYHIEYFVDEMLKAYKERK